MSLPDRIACSNGPLKHREHSRLVHFREEMRGAGVQLIFVDVEISFAALLDRAFQIRILRKLL